MREIGGIYAGDGPKPMGGGIGAMACAGPAPVACAEPGVPSIGHGIVG